MTKNLFEKILADMRREGIGHRKYEVTLFNLGEPFLSPNLFYALQRLREERYITYIFTNGASLTAEKTEQILTFGDVIKGIIFSINGIDEQSYQTIMGMNAQAYDLVKRNVTYFLQLNQNKIPARVTRVLFSQSQDFKRQWPPVWIDKSLLASYGAHNFFNFAGRIHDDLELRENETHIKKPCNRVRHMTILWDGRVCLCCMDAEGEIIFGDVNRQSLLEIYQSERFTYYRQMHAEERWNELPLCKNCNMLIVRRERHDS